MYLFYLFLPQTSRGVVEGVGIGQELGLGVVALGEAGAGHQHVVGEH